MIKIAFANQKGGISKTTSAVNVSSSLVSLGYKVLAIDLDAQGNLSYNYGLDTDDMTNTIYNVFAQTSSLEDVIHKTEFGVDVIPANIIFANAELEISAQMSRESILKNAFIESDLDYDFCILDLPPNLGLLALNGLVSVDYTIIPVDTSSFSLSGLNQLLSTIQLIKKNKLNTKLDVLGVLLTKVDARTNLSKDTYAKLERIFGDKVFNTYIHQNIKVVESQNAQQPINHFAKGNRADTEYTELTRELLERVKHRR